MSSTGSVMAASKTLSKHQESYPSFLTLTNASGGELKVGQEVNIKASTNLSVEKRDAGADFPCGIVSVGGLDGERVTILTTFHSTLKAIAKGGSLVAGVFVKPNGTYNAAGMPEYIVAVDGDFVSGQVISGNLVDGEIEIGMLRAPFRNTAP